MIKFTLKNACGGRWAPIAAICAGLLILLAGCTKTTNDSPPSSDLLSEKNLIYAFEDYSLPASTAASRAQSYFPKTKSGASSKIKQIGYITATNPHAPATKSADSGQADTIMYVINFEDNAGFMILTADYRTDPIVAMSETGNFNTETLNPTVQFVMERAKAAYWEQIDKFEQEKANLGKDELNRLKNKYKHLKLYNKTLAAAAGSEEPGGGGGIGGGGETPPPTEEPEDEWDPDYTEIPPYGPPADVYEVTLGANRSLDLFTKYNQNSPFNDAAPMIGQYRAAAGCVAVATAQVMAYYGHPAIVDGRPLNWSIMNIPWYSPLMESAKSDIAYLLRKVGDRLGNNWGYPETGAHNDYVPGVLRNYGYTMTNNSPWVYNNDTTLISSISKGRPVICGGYEAGTKNGHSWVIDGYRWDNIRSHGWVWNYKLQTYEVANFYVGSRLYIRCNWGWGGYQDGWYRPGYLTAGGSYYNENLRLISHIRLN